MANYLRYTYKVVSDDSSYVTFSDVNDAKTLILFDEVDFTGLSPEYTLEDSNRMLCLKVPFTDFQAHRDMKTFHTNMKDNWAITLGNDSSVIYIEYSVDNKYIVDDSERGVDFE
tara:strand:+ start:139 stop:480 length:342 start_codon:yes stop_codon:yes gene_type:complete